VQHVGLAGRDFSGRGTVKEQGASFYQVCHDEKSFLLRNAHGLLVCSLEYNEIDDQGALALAKMMHVNKQLELR
jgi:hypothetical protein